MEWYQMEVSHVLAELSTDSASGLTYGEAKKRYDRYGANVLREQKGPGIIRLFAEQFRDFMILTLLASALISFVSSCIRGDINLTDPLIILAIVISNALLGVYQEQKAKHSLASLSSLITKECLVKRSGELVTIPATDLVPGDIVELHAGDLVPADGRLIHSMDMTTDESALTGESGGIKKDRLPISDLHLLPGDQTNMVFSGTTVLSGRGLYCVTDTGMETQIGHIADMLSREDTPKTPLMIRLGRTGKLLGIIALLICTVVFSLGVYKDQPIFDMFMTSVSLGVAAIPESLPALVTIMLSLGVEKMAKNSAIIRHLPAVETLGSASIICSDKTGTLTQNVMTVRITFATDDEKNLMKYFLLCNNNAGPMEQALIDYGRSLHLDYHKLQREYPRTYEIPFDGTRKMMTTLHGSSTGYISVTKGAPELILPRCHRYIAGGTIRTLSESTRRDFLRQTNEYASLGLRILAVGMREADGTYRDDQLEYDMTYIGMAGFMDPPRPEVYTAIKSCIHAGIHPVMITGDHKVTAYAIGKELGICTNDDEVMTGAMLDKISDAELPSILDHHHVYARVTPAHKVRLVKGYQAAGHVVAMTGDGVNDAPALQAADIGCAMGYGGTDVAINAADLVLADNNFSTIVAAVREGRGIYDNIKKAIHFLLSCNIGEIMTIFVAILFGLPSPLLPVQLLFINLVTDSFPALCLGVEPADPDCMDRPPLKKGSGMFHFDTVFQMIIEGMLIGSLSLFAYAGGNSTMCFAVLSISQLVHALNMKSEHSLLATGIWSNKKLLLSVILCISLQCSVITVPALQSVFHTVALSLREWMVVCILSLMPIPLVELSKRLR